MTLGRGAQEASRLAALAQYDVLDTPRERDFDEVAELASEICETPIAVVNLIGEGRQFFKAEVGLGVRETPLDSSFCAKAILEEDFLIVPDATADVRFSCNPLVVGEPGLRFYAGALLKARDGYPIGTVCVLDYRPRLLTRLQEKALRVLAQQVMRQLELRRTVRERDASLQQQDILNQEMLHRLKNMLAMVQAIAKQTLRGVTEQDAVEALTKRIVALATASDQLMQVNWTAAPLRRIIRLLLDLHDSGGRIETNGPNIDLGPKATLSMSLLLHELATNAAKYGALSTPAGRVDLSWSVEEGATGLQFTMTWRESGGPKIVEPTKKGFGSRLINLGLLGLGGVEKTYAPMGLIASCTAPLGDLQTL